MDVVDDSVVGGGTTSSDGGVVEVVTGGGFVEVVMDGVMIGEVGAGSDGGIGVGVGTRSGTSAGADCSVGVGVGVDSAGMISIGGVSGVGSGITSGFDSSGGMLFLFYNLARILNKPYTYCVNTILCNSIFVVTDTIITLNTLFDISFA